MGILNVTPDSFSDGGRFSATEDAVRHGLDILAEGADILDVGGESTRPGAAPVDAPDERARVLPVIRAIADRNPDAVLSIDTTKADVADAAIDAGARIINDVSAMTRDARIADVAARTEAGVVLMHMRGTPRTMQEAPAYENVVVEVTDYLRERAERVEAQGVGPEAIAVDPGIGFGKTVAHNLALLAGLETLRTTGRPVVVGLSRKSFLKRLTGRDVADRLAGSLAGLAFCAMTGAQVLRVHDVQESADVVRVIAALRRARGTDTWTG